MIPKSMHIQDCSKDSVEVACGGSANVSQGMYKGRLVAVKAVRVHASDIDTVLSVSVLLALLHWSGERATEVLPRGSRLETPSASKRHTTAWGDGERTPVCDGFRVDGKWKRQRIH